MKLFLQSVRVPERRFQVLSFDPATKKGKLWSCSLGVELAEEHSLDKATLERMGYAIEKVYDEGEQHA